MQSLLLPITQLTVSGRQWPRSLCGDQTYHHIGSMAMVVFRRQHNCGTGFGYVRARRPQRQLRASTVSPILIFETLHSGGCCFSEILVSPGIGPLD